MLTPSPHPPAPSPTLPYTTPQPPESLPPRSQEWDSDAPTPSGEAARRASLFLWIAGGIEVLAFGCCSALLGVYSAMPLSMIQQAMAGQPQQMRDQFEQVHPYFLHLAAGALILGFFPGLLLVLLGFAVRSGHRGATIVALVLAITQALVVAVLLLNAVIGGLMVGDPMSVTLAVLVVGSPLALLALAIRWLLAAMRG